MGVIDYKWWRDLRSIFCFPWAERNGSCVERYVNGELTLLTRLLFLISLMCSILGSAVSPHTVLSVVGGKITTSDLASKRNPYFLYARRAGHHHCKKNVLELTPRPAPPRPAPHRTAPPRTARPLFVSLPRFKRFTASSKRYAPDGRPYYVDHNKHVTSWHHPQGPQWQAEQRSDSVEHTQGGTEVNHGTCVHLISIIREGVPFSVAFLCTLPCCCCTFLILFGSSL